MADLARLTEVIEPEAAALGFELVRVKIMPSEAGVEQVGTSFPRYSSLLSFRGFGCQISARQIRQLAGTLRDWW